MAYGRTSEHVLGSIHDQLVNLNNALDDNVTRQEKLRSQRAAEDTEAALKECHRHLCPSVSYAETKDVIPEHTSGTCRWVFDDPKYISWVNSTRNDLLWITADPGCGKSVLSKALIDNLSLQSERRSVCYFFFKDNTGQTTPSTALSVILYQLFTQQKHLRRHMKEDCDNHGAQLRQQSHVLWQILLRAAADPDARPIWFVIDALDEAADLCRVSLITKLCHFYGDLAHSPITTANLKFFVTSRPYNDVQRVFEGISGSVPEIRLMGENKNDEIGSEIAVVMRNKIQALAETWNLSKQAKLSLEEKILEMQHRTYLWLDLAIDDISRTYETSYDPNLAVINSLPESVDEAYERIFEGVDKKVQKHVRKILHIIVGARRPLSVGELCLALSMLDGVEINREHMRRNLRQWCRLFIFFNHGKIYLIHQTAKEFLLRRTGNDGVPPGSWKSSVDPSAAEQDLLTICVHSLRQDSAESGVNSVRYECNQELVLPQVDVENEQHDLVDDVQYSARPLFRYACEFWLSHAAESQTTPSVTVWDQVSTLYDDLLDRTDAPWIDLTWRLSFNHFVWERKPRQNSYLFGLTSRSFSDIEPKTQYERLSHRISGLSRQDASNLQCRNRQY